MKTLLQIEDSIPSSVVAVLKQVYRKGYRNGRHEFVFDGKIVMPLSVYYDLESFMEGI